MKRFVYVILIWFAPAYAIAQITDSLLKWGVKYQTLTLDSTHTAEKIVPYLNCIMPLLCDTSIIGYYPIKVDKYYNDPIPLLSILKHSIDTREWHQVSAIIVYTISDGREQSFNVFEYFFPKSFTAQQAYYSLNKKITKIDSKAFDGPVFYDWAIIDNCIIFFEGVNTGSADFPFFDSTVERYKFLLRAKCGK